jgi:ATP-dependent Clp protease protease subunit
MSKVGQINIVGSIGGFEVTLQNVMEQVKSLGNVDEYLVIINSAGGEVFEGYAIYNYLLSLNKPLTTRGVGIVASIATVIFLAGKKRQLYNTTQFLIHNPWSMGEGDATEFIRKAEELRVIENNLIDFYHTQTGIDNSTIQELMNEDKFITSETALELKFATEILSPVKAFATFKNQNQNKNQMSKIGKIFKQAFAELKNAGVVLNETIMTKDGQELEVTMSGSTIAVGDEVMDGGQPAEGSYQLADGTEIECKGGIVTAIIQPSASTDTNASTEVEILNAKKSELEEQIANLTSELEALRTENESLKGTNEQMVEEVEAITNHLRKLNIKANVPSAKTSFNKTALDTNTEMSKEDIKARFKELQAKSKSKVTLAI